MKLFITGVTGFLGGELLVNLAKIESISKIYCLVRANSNEKALLRLQEVFEIHNDYFDSSKIIPITGELTDNMLSYKMINNPDLKDVDTVIHCAANTSFTKVYDDLVEKVNIDGTLQILEWAKTLENLEQFVYVGTATVCGIMNGQEVVREEVSPDLNSNHVVKYSYTKMVSEFLLKEHLPEDKVLVVRPSIIMGDSRSHRLRSQVILWALAVFNELRLSPINKKSDLDIVSVDYVAESIIELLFNNQRKYNVYHISSGKESSTTPEKSTSAIQGFYTEKPDFKFVSKAYLAEMKKWARNSDLINEESGLFKHQEYLNYWNDNFGDSKKLRILFYAIEPYIDFIELGQIYDNSRLLEDTNMGPSIPAHEYLKKSKKHFESINVFKGVA